MYEKIFEVVEKQTIDPAKVIVVKGEKLKLSDTPPSGEWWGGTRLKQIQNIEPGKGITVFGAIDAGSLIIRCKDKVLSLDKDYLFDPRWGTVGVAQNSTITANDEVIADYNYSMLRIDTLVCDANGVYSIIKGESHLSTPLPPVIKSGKERIANIFAGYHSDGKKGLSIYPVLASSNDAITQTSAGCIPETLAKIHSGKTVKIVCWGDSVTAGGDSSSPEFAYTSVFSRMLKNKFPNADINVKVVAVGGSNSPQWLYPEKHPKRSANLTWQWVINEKPDLVTIEFVNDSFLKGTAFEDNYNEILRRLRLLNAEVILITPHFTREIPKDKDTREYVSLLKKFAAANRLALADASARWEHLWREGVPYITLLSNAFNHPDDRGHRIFAEELIKCFGEPNKEGNLR